MATDAAPVISRLSQRAASHSVSTTLKRMPEIKVHSFTSLVGKSRRSTARKAAYRRCFDACRRRSHSVSVESSVRANSNSTIGGDDYTVWYLVPDVGSGEQAPQRRIVRAQVRKNCTARLCPVTYGMWGVLGDECAHTRKSLIMCFCDRIMELRAAKLEMCVCFLV